MAFGVLEKKPAGVPHTEFVIYDLETTGLSSEFNEIIQIAAMKFRDGRMVREESFFSYVKPLSTIPAFITRYTGISNAHVADASPACEVIVQFSRFVAGATLIAHNGQRFDSRFLEATCRRHQISTREVRSIDSIQFSRRLFGTVRGTGHGLDRVLSRLAISSSAHARHDARGDVELLGLAIELMWRRLQLDHFCAGIPLHKSSLPL
ncbi:MAG: 3'-5' exonuclease [Verrucomicrobiota bacterium]